MSVRPPGLITAGTNSANISLSLFLSLPLSCMPASLSLFLLNSAPYR